MSVPDNVGHVRKWFIGYCNIFVKDNPYRLLSAILIGGVGGVVGSMAYMFARAPDYAGGPDSWIRYIPISTLLVLMIFLNYFAVMFWLKAGGDVLVVEGYKRRKADRAARRTAERRKRYRPISARELDA
ncbi:MAG: hypothetical protein MJE68_20200 [Proteobacteria bacterium]|nr:hypothetical protein [Pseudomonadota bacterium]